jgi:hypothetical protein
VAAAAVAPLLALVVAACTSVGGSGAPSMLPTSPMASPMVSPGPSASGAAGTCPVSPTPATPVEGWEVSAQRPTVFPQIINPSGTIACGATRLMFSFLDADNVPVAAPDRTVEVALYDLGADPASPAITAPATFIWAIEPSVGVYVVDASFPTSGTWGAEMRTAVGSAARETIRLQFEVQPTSSVVAVGDQAPASDTPTLADVAGDAARISTDPDPVPAFYETSVADALQAGKPFVLVFATPKFCATAQCGPTLERLKPIASAHPDLTVINVEPYELEMRDGQLQPVLTGDRLTPTRATVDWRLPAEPWVFVVDKDGVVTASFMLIFSDEELEAAIAEVDPA